MEVFTTPPGSGSDEKPHNHGWSISNLLTVVFMVITLLGWSIVGYQSIQKQLDTEQAEIALQKQRSDLFDTALNELRSNLHDTVNDTRAQLGKISDQLNDLRTLVAGLDHAKH